MKKLSFNQRYGVDLRKLTKVERATALEIAEIAEREIKEGMKPVGYNPFKDKQVIRQKKIKIPKADRVVRSHPRKRAKQSKENINSVLTKDAKNTIIIDSFKDLLFSAANTKRRYDVVVEAINELDDYIKQYGENRVANSISRIPSHYIDQIQNGKGLSFYEAVDGALKFISDILNIQYDENIDEEEIDDV